VKTNSYLPGYQGKQLPRLLGCGARARSGATYSRSPLPKLSVSGAAMRFNVGTERCASNARDQSESAPLRFTNSVSQTDLLTQVTYVWPGRFSCSRSVSYAEKGLRPQMRARRSQGSCILGCILAAECAQTPRLTPDCPEANRLKTGRTRGACTFSRPPPSTARPLLRL